MRMPVYPDRRTQMPMRPSGLAAFGGYPSIVDSGVESWVNADDHDQKSDMPIAGCWLRPMVTERLSGYFAPDALKATGTGGSLDYSGTTVYSLVDAASAVLQQIQMTGGGFSYADFDLDDPEHVDTFEQASYCSVITITADARPVQFNGVISDMVMRHDSTGSLSENGGNVHLDAWPLLDSMYIGGSGEAFPCRQEFISSTMREV